MNWPGLLAWSTKYYDGTTPSQLGPMSEERKQFLMNALESSMGGKMEDQNARLKAHLAKLVTERDEKEIDSILDVIDECADYPDCCDNFAKLGGFDAFATFLSTSSNARISQGLSILGVYLSNNPSIQDAACRAGFLDIFVSLTKSSDADVSYRAITAIGQLIRGAPVIERNFVSSQGIDFLCSNLASHDPRVVEKCLLLLSSLLASSPDVFPKELVREAIVALPDSEELSLLKSRL